MPGCLALRTGPLLVVVFHQSAPGMSCAKPASQVGLFLFKRILATVFQAAIICRLQQWQESTISLLTQKGGVAKLRDEGVVPNLGLNVQHK
eukprot:scaffold268047_cov14-Tisochrysis_lutea.AAC.1